MSLHHQLKSIDQPLRGLMNKRDRYRKDLSKHARKITSYVRQMQKADTALEDMKEKTAENNAAWTDAVLMHEEYLVKLKALLATAEKEVDKRLEELSAL